MNYQCLQCLRIVPDHPTADTLNFHSSFVIYELASHCSDPFFALFALREMRAAQKYWMSTKVLRSHDLRRCQLITEPATCNAIAERGPQRNIRRLGKRFSDMESHAVLELNGVTVSILFAKRISFAFRETFTFSRRGPNKKRFERQLDWGQRRSEFACLAALVGGSRWVVVVQKLINTFLMFDALRTKNVCDTFYQHFARLSLSPPIETIKILRRSAACRFVRDATGQSDHDATINRRKARSSLLFASNLNETICGPRQVNSLCVQLLDAFSALFSRVTIKSHFCSSRQIFSAFSLETSFVSITKLFFSLQISKPREGKSFLRTHKRHFDSFPTFDFSSLFFHFCEHSANTTSFIDACRINKTKTFSLVAKWNFMKMIFGFFFLPFWLFSCFRVLCSFWLLCFGVFRLFGMLHGSRVFLVRWLDAFFVVCVDVVFSALDRQLIAWSFPEKLFSSSCFVPKRTLHSHTLTNAAPHRSSKAGSWVAIALEHHLPSISCLLVCSFCGGLLIETTRENGEFSGNCATIEHSRASWAPLMAAWSSKIAVEELFQPVGAAVPSNVMPACLRPSADLLCITL